MKALKELARKWTSEDGAVTFWLLPYTPIKAEMIIRQMRSIVDKEEWNSVEDTFVYLDALTVDFETTDDAHSGYKTLSLYFKERTGNIAQDYELYTQFVSMDVSELFWEAYHKTRGRELLNPNPPEASTAKDIDPNLEGDGLESSSPSLNPSSSKQDQKQRTNKKS